MTIESAYYAGRVTGRIGSAILAAAALLAACSSGGSGRASPTTRNEATSATARCTTGYCASSHPPAAARAVALCRDAFGNNLLSSAPTTVREVRRSGIGVVGNLHPHAFPGLSASQFAAWCMMRTNHPHCWDEWALGVNRAREHIVKTCDPTLGVVPRAGPPYWTG